ncbi:hypothetical protein [Aminobacter sp. AP02]|uniref:hypothetical protein n=1 Tax=Aminobacter sp. AP02 TaxID=2135737 RepID=UPI000D6CB229|nr:hypothetical protein [Aminobacter sp. AP02]PWK59686.1 hypothetical protein C8K44_1434 [Aminobacter sp. AP02]
MSTFIPRYVNNKSLDQVGGPVDVDLFLFSEPVASVRLDDLFGSSGMKRHDRYECLIIPAVCW